MIFIVLIIYSIQVFFEKYMYEFTRTMSLSLVLVFSAFILLINTKVALPS